MHGENPQILNSGINRTEKSDLLEEGIMDPKILHVEARRKILTIPGIKP
jgi:hypothetical protein